MAKIGVGEGTALCPGVLTPYSTSEPIVDAHVESGLGRFGDNNVLLMCSNVWRVRSITGTNTKHWRWCKALALV